MTNRAAKAGAIDDAVWAESPQVATVDGPERRGSHHILASLLLAALFAVLWVFLAAITSSALIRVFDVPSGSMTPTVGIGQRIAVSLTADPGRGDIVVLRPPPQATLPAGADVLKRIVAVGGDTVWCCRAGHLVVNGEVVAEPYAPRSQPQIARVRVPAGDVFVLGDNRLDSQDSKSWGPVPSDLVIGTVVAQGAAATLLSPLVVGGIVAGLLTFGVWVLWIRRTSWWRGSGATGRTGGAAHPLL